MKIVKYIINLILSFLLVLAILFYIAINCVSNKILNKDYMLSKLNETEFYTQISREVQNGFENYIYQSGLPEDTIKNLYTDDIIKNDVNSIIDFVYEEKDIIISDKIIRENLENKINEYINSQNIKLNNQGKENIKKFEDLVVGEYSKNINVSNTLYSTAKDSVKKIKPIYNKLKNIPVTIIIIDIILIVIINIKDIILALNFISISSLSSGILLKLAEKIIVKNVDIDNLVILSQSLSNLIINIAKEILYNISDYGNILVICGIVGIIASSIAKNFPKK